MKIACIVVSLILGLAAFNTTGETLFTLKTPLPKTIEGKVRTLAVASSTMAEYLSEDYYDWLNESFDAMVVYPPWFDEHTEGYSDGFVYKDLYAIYDCRLPYDPNHPGVYSDGTVEPDSEMSICAGANQSNLLGLYNAAMEAEADPLTQDWILKDADGNPLYIHFPDAHGRYSQFAADVSNVTFRQFWLSQLETLLNIDENTPSPYRGIFIDDVNMQLDKSVSNGECRLIDVTKSCYWQTQMSAEQWASSMVAFVQEVRASFPDHEITHNSVWYHTTPDPSHINAQIAAADIINVERGFHDAGLNTNTVAALFSFHDKVHSLHRHISHYIRVADQGNTGVLAQLRELEHGLAGWLLISGGRDYFGADDFVFPGLTWEGFAVNLGEALSERSINKVGLYQRAFDKGMVLLNPDAANPANGPKYIQLPGYFRTLSGDCVSELSLPPASGKILFSVNSCMPTYNSHFTSVKTL
jgi:hypothetical protein